MRSMTLKRVKRTLLALLMMFVLSFSTALAETEAQTESTGEAVQAEVSAETGAGSTQTAETQPETPAVVTPAPAAPAPTPAPAPVVQSRIFKKGRYYYYRNPNGKIRKKAGFVTDCGKRYYIRKGGKIRTGKIFKVKKKYYCADVYGVIQTGVYKWGGYYYYSSSSGVLRKTAGLVSWNGSLYYVNKGGKITANEGFSVNNLPYAADAAGRATRLAIPDGGGSPVIGVAKAQVGIMTGKTYWIWYYKTRFRDTDRTPWCGAFVAWCYNKAGLYNKITVAKKYGPLGYVPSYSRFADKHGKWVNRYTAQGGDIIVFGRNRHVGLVEGIVGDYIITIEGNAGPTAIIGCKKPGAVVRNAYKINSSQIKGVIRPD